MPDISTEKVCFIIVKARELDVKVAPEELDEGSNPTDDAMQRILEDYADDPTREELRSFLAAQSDDELRELVALAWIGRGDYEASDWDDVLSDVDDPRASAAFPDEEQGQVLDDHTPFVRRGVPSIDLIDFTFRCWHKTCDDLSAVSKKSLDSSGEAVLEFLRRRS